jgi:membrane protease YdiL (CAAX protease family)
MSKLAFYLGVISALVEIYLGIRYLLISPDEADRLFGALTMMEGIFAIIGLYAIDLLQGKRVSLRPEEFEPISGKTWFRFPVILIVLMITQAIFQFVPLTVRDYEKAAAIIFAAPAEELFFRGVIFGSFMKLGENDVKFNVTKTKKISTIEVVGILVSALFFAMIHVNYYGNISLLLAVFSSGIVLALFYWLWKDITSLVLAHFLLNIISVIQIFYLVGF